MDLSYFADFEGTRPVTNSRLDAAHHSKKFLGFISTLEDIVANALAGIEEADIEEDLSYSYNTLEIIIPSYHVQRYIPGLDVDIVVLFMRTNFTDAHNLRYTADNISQFYRNASITIGRAHSVKNYHINLRHTSRTGGYTALNDSIARLYRIEKKHDVFPQLTGKGLDELADNLITVVNPQASHFPRSFSVN